MASGRCAAHCIAYGRPSASRAVTGPHGVSTTRSSRTSGPTATRSTSVSGATEPVDVRTNPGRPESGTRRT